MIPRVLLLSVNVSLIQKVFRARSSTCLMKMFRNAALRIRSIFRRLRAQGCLTVVGYAHGIKEIHKPSSGSSESQNRYCKIKLVQHGGYMALWSTWMRG